MYKYQKQEIEIKRSRLMAKSEYLECGKVHNTHGCHGWVKVESYCDSPAALARLPQVYRRVAGEYVALHVLDTGRKQETVLMQLEGIDDMDKAELLKGEILYARRADIPLAEGAYFLADLPGLAVIDADNGKVYGSVKEISFAGGREMLLVKTPTGDRLLPMVDAFLVRVDVDSGVFVRPIPGLLED
jgi:16S rRNA processing protein RimM